MESNKENVWFGEKLNFKTAFKRSIFVSAAGIVNSSFLSSMNYQLVLVPLTRAFPDNR